MIRVAALSIFALALSAGAAALSSTATPVPGGAHQASGVAGTFGDKLFNGEIRLEIRNASDSASNGTAHALDMQQFVAWIADSDGDTFQAQPDKVKPMGGVFGVPPGGQWKQILFGSVKCCSNENRSATERSKTSSFPDHASGPRLRALVVARMAANALM